jgi:hypothetical protein
MYVLLGMFLFLSFFVFLIFFNGKDIDEYKYKYKNEDFDQFAKRIINNFNCLLGFTKIGKIVLFVPCVLGKLILFTGWMVLFYVRIILFVIGNIVKFLILILIKK